MAYAGSAYAAAPYAGDTSHVANDGVLTATLPALAGSISGTSTPPPATAALAGALPLLAAILGGDVHTEAALAGTLPALSADLGGWFAEEDRTATLDGTLPALAGALAGTYTPPSVTGDLAALLPGLTADLAGGLPGVDVLNVTLPAFVGAFTGSVAVIEVGTDLRNRANGRNRTGSGENATLLPVATPPSRTEPIRIMAQQMPTPTLRKGRPT